MDIIKKLQTIFDEKLHLKIKDDYFLEDTSIGASGIGLNTIGMFYLIHFIETEFNIKFTREQITSGVIRTLPGLCKAIEELQKETVPEFEKSNS